MFMKTKEASKFVSAPRASPILSFPRNRAPTIGPPPSRGVTVWWKIGAIGIGESPSAYIKLPPTMFMKTEMVRGLSGNLHEKVSH